MQSFIRNVFSNRQATLIIRGSSLVLVIVTLFLPMIYHPEYSFRSLLDYLRVVQSGSLLFWVATFLYPYIAVISVMVLDFVVKSNGIRIYRIIALIVFILGFLNCFLFGLVVAFPFSFQTKILAGIEIFISLSFFAWTLKQMKQKKSLPEKCELLFNGIILYSLLFVLEFLTTYLFRQDVTIYITVFILLIGLSLFYLSLLYNVYKRQSAVKGFASSAIASGISK